MYPHMEEVVYTARTEGPFHFAPYTDWNRQILRGNSVDASNPLRASLQVHLCLRHAKPVDAMVSVLILFHALSCHKYLASLHSRPPSFIRFTVGCTSVSKRNSLDISFFDISSLWLSSLSTFLLWQRTDNSHIALIRCHKSLDLCVTSFDET
jgi:hypothetical protein